MSTLYRKYRPQRWADVAGQNHVKVTLAFEAQTGRVAHAYLFSGPRGTGKTTVARLFARAINCTGRSEVKSSESKVKSSVDSQLSTLNSQLPMGEPCGNCRNCLLIDSGASMDIIEVDAASHTGVDNVRDNIIENARFAPAQFKYKVFVIDEVHMLSTAAFNALLKTLEEPPAKTVFILATTELHKVPATVLSRCQRFDFRKIPFADAVERLKSVAALEGKKVDRRVLEEIARHSDGGLRDAEGLLGKVLTSVDEKKKDITYDDASVVLPRSDEALVAAFVEGLLRRDAAAAVTAVQSAADSGVDMDHFAGETVEALRRSLLARVGVSLDVFAPELDESRRAQVEAWGRLADAPAIILALETVMEKRRDLKSSHIPTLPLELAAARICSDMSLAKPDFQPPISSSPAPTASKPPSLSRLSGGTPPSLIEGKVAGQTATPSPTHHSPSEAAAESRGPEEAWSGKHEAGSANTDSKTPTATNLSNSAPPNLRTSKPPATSLDKVRSHWTACVAKAGEASSSLAFLLSVAEPLQVDGNCVHVGFGFAFHRDKFNEAKTRDLVAKALSAVLGMEVSCHGALLDKNPVLRQDDTASVRASASPEPQKAPTADPFITDFGAKRIA